MSSGYHINEMGLYAKEKDGDSNTEVLYSITTIAGDNGDFMPPYNGYNPAQIIQDYIVTVNNTADVTIQTGIGAVALAEDLEELRRTVSELASHVPMHFFGTRAEMDAVIEDLPVGTIVFLPDDEENS